MLTYAYAVEEEEIFQYLTSFSLLGRISSCYQGFGIS